MNASFVAACRKTTRFADEIGRNCRFVAIFVLGLVVSGNSGCSTTRPAITSRWPQVPQVRWSSRDARDASAAKERTSEPAVAANVAVKSEETVEPESTGTVAKNESSSKSRLSRIGSRFHRSDSRPQEVPKITSINPIEDADTSTDSKRSDSPLDRLNAALTDDAIHAQALPERSLTTLEDRVHVESLLMRAKRLVEIGQLDQARRTAQLAQELSDSAQIDYSPDEDRPIDLVRRIEVELEGTGPANDASQDETATNSDDDEAPKTTAEVDNPQSPAIKGASGLNRMRRDWSTLFRRDKKSAVIEPNATDQPSFGKVSSTDGASEDRKSSVTAIRSTAGIERDAIVMANRSLILETPEPATHTSESIDPSASPDGNGSPPIEEEKPALAKSENWDDPSGEQSPSSDSTDSPAASLASEEESVALPEFEITEYAANFREVESTINEPSLPVSTDSGDTSGRSDWTPLYVVFGLCSLLAFGCYRRGAT